MLCLAVTHPKIWHPEADIVVPSVDALPHRCVIYITVIATPPTQCNLVHGQKTTILLFASKQKESVYVII